MSYFVYVISVGPLQMLESHIVEGPELSVRRTRELVCSGAQVRDLMFVSEVMSDNETHHDRRHKSITLHEKIDEALDRTASDLVLVAAKT
jgi:hypothetical protein